VAPYNKEAYVLVWVCLYTIGGSTDSPTRRHGKFLTVHIFECCKNVSGQRRSRCIWITWRGCRPYRILQNTAVAKTFELNIWYSTCSGRVLQPSDISIPKDMHKGPGNFIINFLLHFSYKFFVPQNPGCESCSYRWTCCALTTLAVQELRATFSDVHQVTSKSSRR